MPLISFGIPAYNSPFFDAAFRSVLAQTVADIEVIISDDGHRAETRAIVERLGDARVRYVPPDGPAGVPANWNRCLRLASGTYFVLLPDDDLIAPDFAERMAGALEARPQAGLAQCGLVLIDGAGQVLDDRHVRPPADFLRGVDALAWQLDTMRVNPAALMFRRSVLVAMGGWEEAFWDDWALTLRIAFRHGFAYVDAPLASVRTHDTNLSKTVMRGGGRDEVLDIINQQTAVFGDALPVTDELLALRARWMRDVSHRAVIKAFKYAFAGRLRLALLHYRRARSLYPLAPLHPGFLRIALRNKLDTLAAYRRSRTS